MKTLKQTHGFSLIEALIALLILSTILVITLPVIDLFKLSRNNKSTLDATTQAQRLLEEIQSSWASRANYDARCATITTPSNVSITVFNRGLFTASNNDGNSTALVSSCPASSDPNPPSMRRVRIVVSNAGREEARVQLDFRRPNQP